MEENINDTNENEQPISGEPLEEEQPDSEELQEEEQQVSEESVEEEQAEETPSEEQPEHTQSIYEDPNADVVAEDESGQEEQKDPKTYTPPQNYQQKYQQSYDQDPNSDASPLSLGDSLILVILFAIPCVNLIVALVWAFGGTKNINRRNISRAELIVWAVVIVLSILFYVVFAATIYSGLTG